MSVIENSKVTVVGAVGLAVQGAFLVRGQKHALDQKLVLEDGDEWGGSLHAGSLRSRG